MDMQDYFTLDDDLIYVNHAAVAPWPIRTAKAVTQFADENACVGSSHYLRWLDTESRLRDRLKLLINAESSDEIALLKSTSEALSVIAYGIDWQPGDSIVTAAEEFPSNRLVWESLKPLGVDVRLVEYTTGQSAEEALLAAVDDSTRLLSISAVQYASGRRMDLQKIGDHCHQHQVLFCVDAIQAIGALQFDVQKIHADFVAADGHKWMLGPEGLALFYCRRELLDRLKLNQFGWHMVENNTDYDAMDQWQPAQSARRFECGSPNMLGTHALEASLSVIEEVGIEAIEEQILDNTDFLMTELAKLQDVEVLSPGDQPVRSGIVTFHRHKSDQSALFQYLKDQQVVCALRGGGIRISPHFYTPREKLDRLLQLIADAPV